MWGSALILPNQQDGGWWIYPSTFLNPIPNFKRNPKTAQVLKTTIAVVILLALNSWIEKPYIDA
jgi:hypothetical protein